MGNKEHKFSPKDVARFWSKVDRRSDECWPWTGGCDSDGYGNFSYTPSVGAGDINIKAHRASWIIANGLLRGLFVCHRCDNPCCVNPSHLFLGTNAENLADMARKGRSLGGARHPRARLTLEEVVEAKVIYMHGGGCPAIARAFGISRTHMRRILDGGSWQ